MGANTVSPEGLATLVDRLRWDKRRHPYHGRGEYQATAHQALETATALVEAGHAQTVVRTLRTAVDRVTRTLMYLDDSSGIVGDALQELTDLYARALELAPPASPKTLASWLVAAQFDGPGWPASTCAPSPQPSARKESPTSPPRSRPAPPVPHRTPGALSSPSATSANSSLNSPATLTTTSQSSPRT
ncbi:hypothetical protein OG196_32425 [Kitasatospora purpeofusca]|uniref:hypothetical protein n=1 Tax=Kitasatospora purpeofusca TaxID=67352 RepID=UPI002E10B7BF|nr:hypothetical protein OG715_31380 [Kitasatospora purpeofusca]WSR43385.1 hypothetical protein OG196_32425 [Kitasatospora purpeofusca]